MRIEPPLPQPTVLVVDDDAGARLLARAALARHGCAVREAERGEQALDLFRRAPADIVLLDVMMPQMDGFDVCAALRRLPSGAHVPVLMITGLDDLESIQRAYDVGATDFITKPLNWVVLGQRVRYVLRASRAFAALRESEARLAEAQELARLGNWKWDLERDVLVASAEVHRILGLGSNGFLGAADALLARVHPEDRERLAGILEQARRGAGPFGVDHRIVTPDGTYRVVHTQGRSVQNGSEVPRYVIGTLQDITERKRVEEALRRSEERYAIAARGANDGLWDWDLRTDRIYYSPRWKAMLGYGEDQMGDDPREWLDRIHPDDLSQVRSALANHRDGATAHFESEHRMRHKDGGYRWVLCRGLALRDSRGGAYRMAGSQSDITERRRAEDQLLHDAFHDGLTGLANRALFLDRLAHTLSFAARHRDYVFAVVFLDLDRFKVINDSLGHACGDQLLIEVSERLKRCMRAADTVARLGGDEFTLLLDDVKDVATVTRFVERLQQELQQPFRIDEHEVVTTASIGITLSTTGYDRPENMLRDADTAMYRAKALGKARYEVFDAEMHREAAALLEVETELRRAIRHHEFRLHYQPIMALGSGNIRGFEALLRWYHPQRGVLEPEAFLEVAEETGLMLPIGRWVLREAAYQMRAWQEQWPQARAWFVAVNLGSKEFAQPDLVAEIDRVLAETGLDPRSLEIEITEKVLIDNASGAPARLQALRERGIALAIDDFGTGYSSLSYLHQFPFDTLKIDRSFVGGLDVREDAAQIVEAIVTLAHKMGLDVVAEGSETPRQTERLRALRCEYAQGYVYAEPMNAEAATAMLAARLDDLRET